MILERSLKIRKYSVCFYIREVVHMSYKDITDNNIADYTSKWLAQANVRLIREKVEDDLEEKKENVK